MADLVHLRSYSVVHFLVTVPERGDENAAEEIQVLAAVGVFDPDSASANERQGFLIERLDARIDELEVARPDLLRATGHGCGARIRHDRTLGLAGVRNVL